jgi:hypothetical protein
MKIKIHQPDPPPELLKQLSAFRFRYTNPLTLFHFVCLGDGDSCGVFGDGDYGSYEWFVVDQGVLRKSDHGYGSPEAALRAALEAS